MVVVGFFWVHGGIYGNEAMLMAGPPLYVFVMLGIVPFIYSLPIALIVAELSTAFPEVRLATASCFHCPCIHCFGPTCPPLSMYIHVLSCCTDAMTPCSAAAVQRCSSATVQAEAVQ